MGPNSAILIGRKEVALYFINKSIGFFKTGGRIRLFFFYIFTVVYTSQEVVQMLLFPELLWMELVYIEWEVKVGKGWRDGSV